VHEYKVGDKAGLNLFSIYHNSVKEVGALSIIPILSS